MDKPRTTPKDFFLWAGAMVALYVSVFSFLGLVFSYINYAFPNPLQNYYVDPYQSGISYEMASLIVMFPLFFVLMRVIHNEIRRDSSRREIWVRRWALMLTLFLAGLTMAIDLIVLFTTFLSGEELTVAFLLKIALVFLVAAAAFMHFMADFWGFWEKYPQRALSVGIATTVLVFATIVAGFFIVGTPQQARQHRLDQQKISDLQQIQSEVVSYYQAKQKLPVGLSDLNNSLSYFTLPKDPQTGQDYGYRITTPPYSFEVCATFNDSGSSMGSDKYAPRPVDPVAMHVGGGMDNWQHQAGQTCFERTIDPELYPALNNNAPVKNL
jgi:hypothetical protein